MWDKLSMSQRSELMGIYLKQGVSSIQGMKKHYNSFGEGGSLIQNIEDKAKNVYYQNIKPAIDKTITNPIAATLIGGIPGLIASQFYKPDFDARSASTQDEAYNMARSTGAKTFIWNGDHYNTDYKGDPNKTLVQQKQEELDTYGITNEQTLNKNKFEQNFVNTVGFRGGAGAPISTAFNALFNIKNNQRDLQDKYLDNNLFFKEHTDALGLTIGIPQKYDSYKISDFKPENAEEDYYLAYKNRDPITTTTGSNLDKDKVRAKFRESHKSYETSKNEFSEYIVKGMVQKDRDVSKLKKGNNLQKGDTSMGQFTIGVTDDYKSYYDKWDLNPFGGVGNSKNPIKVGNPLNIYDRKYNKKK